MARKSNTPVRKDLVARAVAFLRKVDGTAPVSSMMAFLEKKGLTDVEIMEALNAASDGALVAAALPELAS